MDKYALISVETVRTLAHIALLAASEGYVPSSERILHALQLARPKEPTIDICRAMVLARQEKFAESIDLLRALERECPRNQTVKSLLGFMLFMSEDSGWKPLIKAVIEDGSDLPSVELARMILSEADEPATAASGDSKPGRRFIGYA
jgi:Bacterial type III secretion protein (HrpB1_HrpK)